MNLRFFNSGWRRSSGAGDTLNLTHNHNRNFSAKTPSHLNEEITSKIRIKSKNSGALGFTMVEIAISLAVIAFALVAIVGVLPMGLNVQRENKEDTTVNQDGQYFLELIRNASQGADKLTNFVEFITIERWSDDGVTNVTRYYYEDAFPNADDAPYPPGNKLGPFDIIRSGKDIIGLLSTPKFVPSATPGAIITNRVSALVHTLNGAAIEEGKDTRDLSFAYQLTSEIVPYAFFAPASTSALLPATNATDLEKIPYNRYLEVTKLCATNPNINNTTEYVGFLGDINANMFDVRLLTRWPVRPNGIGGPRRQQFRTVATATLTNEIVNPPGLSLWFFRPQESKRP